MSTHPLIRRTVRLVTLCVLSFLFVGPVVSAAPTGSQAAVTTDDSLAAPGPAARPLAELLRPDGTLDLVGFHGSLDAHGWQLVSRPDQAPRFARTRGPVLAPDDHWDDRFYLPGTDGAVRSLAVDGSGTLYAGGRFFDAGGVPANNIAKWGGTAWAALGSGVDNWVNTLAVDGSGTLYAGGTFTTAGGGVPANNVARWDGSSWSALGAGPGFPVYALAVDSSGTLYAGGGYCPWWWCVGIVARWDGAAWSTLGTMDNYVVALAWDGAGSLYAGGYFSSHIAIWDGSSWSALGSGTDGGVNALALDDSGDLYAGGAFTTAGGLPANHIARWDGTAWSALSSGMDYEVRALAVDGGGNLYAGGWFTTAGGAPANYIARWDGAAWSALGSGMGGCNPNACPVYALAVDDSGNLYAGGWFATAGGKASARIARWHNTPPQVAGDGYSTVEDTPLVVAAPGLLGNDNDPDGDPLTAALDIPPGSGTLVLFPDGALVYTPTLNFNGLVTFTYAVTDGYGGLSTATVAITLTAVNDAPLVADDAYTTSKNTPLVVPAPGVLGNDSDPDGDPLSATLSTPPLSGTLAFQPDGSFVYTPTLNFHGLDTFTYVASDGLLTDTASVIITVTAVNDAPLAVADAYTTTEDTPLVVPVPGVLGNDSDPDGDPLTAVLVRPPLQGTLVLDADGSFVFTPTVGYSGVVTSTYQADDGLARSSPATVTITVMPAQQWQVYLPLVVKGTTP